MRPSRGIAVGDKAASRRTRLAVWLAERCPERVTEDDWRELRRLLAPVSEGYLRKLLRESGAALAPLVEGVRQEDLDALERSLVALEREYGAATDAGLRERARACRRLVIAAKDHARWSAARAGSAEQRREKEEMAAWMLVWLENPPLFPVWIRLRRHAPESGGGLAG